MKRKDVAYDFMLSSRENLFMHGIIICMITINPNEEDDMIYLLCEIWPIQLV